MLNDNKVGRNFIDAGLLYSNTWFKLCGRHLDADNHRADVDQVFETLHGILASRGNTSLSENVIALVSSIFVIRANRWGVSDTVGISENAP